jgi:hypothetical protein
MQARSAGHLTGAHRGSRRHHRCEWLNGSSIFCCLCVLGLVTVLVVDGRIISEFATCQPYFVVTRDICLSGMNLAQRLWALNFVFWIVL